MTEACSSTLLLGEGECKASFSGDSVRLLRVGPASLSISFPITLPHVMYVRHAKVLAGE